MPTQARERIYMPDNGNICRQRKKAKQENMEGVELACIATEGLAKLAMHAGRWQGSSSCGMEESQVVQVPILDHLFEILSLKCS